MIGKEEVVIDSLQTSNQSNDSVHTAKDDEMISNANNNNYNNDVSNNEDIPSLLTNDNTQPPVLDNDRFNQNTALMANECDNANTKADITGDENTNHLLHTSDTTTPVLQPSDLIVVSVLRRSCIKKSAMIASRSNIDPGNVAGNTGFDTVHKKHWRNELLIMTG